MAQHKYLMYFDSKFPYFHQNIITINLGKSYSVNEGVDVALTMTRAQGSYVKSEITYPSGLVEYSADDLHSATYMSESQDASAVHSDRFTETIPTWIQLRVVNQKSAIPL